MLNEKFLMGPNTFCPKCSSQLSILNAIFTSKLNHFFSYFHIIASDGFSEETKPKIIWRENSNLYYSFKIPSYLQATSATIQAPGIASNGGQSQTKTRLRRVACTCPNCKDGDRGRK